MLTTLTSITAHAAMQALLLKTTPKIDSNFQVTEEAKLEADRYRSMTARLGLAAGQSIKDWEATKNVIRGERDTLVEVELTEEDRNTIIALLERDISEKEESLKHHRQMNTFTSIVTVYQALVDVLKGAVKELSEKVVQE